MEFALAFLFWVFFFFWFVFFCFLFVFFFFWFFFFLSFFFLFFFCFFFFFFVLCFVFLVFFGGVGFCLGGFVGLGGVLVLDGCWGVGVGLGGGGSWGVVRVVGVWGVGGWWCFGGVGGVGGGFSDLFGLFVMGGFVLDGVVGVLVLSVWVWCGVVEFGVGGVFFVGCVLVVSGLGLGWRFCVGVVWGGGWVVVVCGWGATPGQRNQAGAVRHCAPSSPRPIPGPRDRRASRAGSRPS